MSSCCTCLTWRNMYLAHVAVHVRALHHPRGVLLVEYSPEHNQRTKDTQKWKELPQHQQEGATRRLLAHTGYQWLLFFRIYRSCLEIISNSNIKSFIKNDDTGAGPSMKQSKQRSITAVTSLTIHVDAKTRKQKQNAQYYTCTKTFQSQEI